MRTHFKRKRNTKIDSFKDGERGGSVVEWLAYCLSGPGLDAQHLGVKSIEAGKQIQSLCKKNVIYINLLKNHYLKHLY